MTPPPAPVTQEGPTIPDSARFWGRLHSDPRFLPVFPDEHVVRFVFRNFGRSLARPMRALDLGCGGGRHLSLLTAVGFDALGLDISRPGLAAAHAAAPLAHLARASMTALPAADATFDAVVCYGVLYYGTQAQMDAGIREIHRVLKPGGRAFVVMRTTHDQRFGRGTNAGAPHTFVITTSDTNEGGTVQHFVPESEVPARFAQFSDVSFELSETTVSDRKAKNSDWLIQARK